MIESQPAAPEEAVTPEGVVPSNPDEYVADIGFDDLPLSPEIRKALAERGYTRPTPVQAKAFGPVFEGKDLIVRSKTGTGKTAAFGLPLLEKLSADDKAVRVLILCPTRELAMQVAAELSDLGKHKGIRVSAIYGGASMKTQEDALELGSPIIVGTPGRIFDHIRRKNLNLEGCNHVVLDEADEMLNQGFYEEVTRILDVLPKTRQVLLFSASMPPDIQNLISRYTQNPQTLLLSGDVFTVEHIHHIRYEISDAYPKPRNLIYVLEMHEPDNAIVFCNTKDDTALVTAVLNRHGFDAELLNGDLPQKERERVMAKIKRGEVAFMVATDIAARGIDISDLGHVINYSLPEDPAVYLHRVGRTGRIGKKGVALNLTSGRELSTLTALEKKYGIHFEKRAMPSPEVALNMWTERHVKEIKSASSGSVYEGYLTLASQLKTRTDADDLIAFLLKSFFTHHRMEKMKSSSEEPEQPERTFRKDPPPRERERSSAPKGRDRERPPRDREARGTTERPARRPRSASAMTSEAVTSMSGETSAPTKPPKEDLPEGQARLWVNLGRSDKLDSDANVLAALEAAGAPVAKVLRVELRPTFSYAIVAEADVGAFEATSGKAHNQKTLKVERARRR